jgi:Predicted nucleotide-binding protein containing TIR-like domain
MKNNDPDNDRLAILILSSRTQLEKKIPAAMQTLLAENKIPKFEVTVWNQGLFRAGQAPLNAFLKRLLWFDAAIVVLGDDDFRLDPDTNEKHPVPRDNVIFELGACMARFSKDRTFMVCPKSKEVVLPSYFKGIPVEYYDDARMDGQIIPAVAVAVNNIVTRLESFDATAHFASLPAAGLAFGYCDNFVKPAYDIFAAGAEGKLRKELEKKGKREFVAFAPPSKFKIHVVVPERPINRDSVQKLFLADDDGTLDAGAILREQANRIKRRKIRFGKYQLSMANGRDISIYATVNEADKRFLVFDVPTTLMTTLTAIDKVSKFWEGADKPFEDKLAEREAVTFRRAISGVVKDRQLAADVAVISMYEFEKIAFD